MIPNRPNQHEGLDGGRHSGPDDDDDEDNPEYLADHDSYLSDHGALFDDIDDEDDEDD